MIRVLKDYRWIWSFGAFVALVTTTLFFFSATSEFYYLHGKLLIQSALLLSSAAIVLGWIKAFRLWRLRTALICSSFTVAHLLIFFVLYMFVAMAKSGI